MSIFEKNGVEKYSSHSGAYKIECFDSVVSTNDTVKNSNEREWYTVFADSQSGGRGRLDRVFHSPLGGGIYMSVLLYPECEPEDTSRLTVMAAVSATEALRSFGVDAGIKWVNDIYVNERKACGILCENMITAENGSYKNKCAVGIGINVFSPDGGFPGDIAESAGVVFPDDAPDRETLYRVAAAVLDRLYENYPVFKTDELMNRYRDYSFIIGRLVDVYPASGGSALYSGKVLGIDDGGRLEVFENGRHHLLDSGEVRLKIRR